METFFKKYFWTLNVVVVILAGVVTARTVSALAASRLAEAPRVEAPTDDRPRAAPVTAVSVDDAALARIFGLSIPQTEPVDTGEPELPPPGTEVPTSLNATLVATIEANPERWSLAVITDNGSRETGVFGVGDTLMGSAEVLKVERRRVLVRNGGRTEYLEMDAEDGAAPPRPPVTMSPGDRLEASASAEGIRKVGEHEYVVDQGEIEGALSNLNQLATQARIVPAFKNGVAQGFKLFSIRPGSLYAKIGIQNGDVIKQINGYDLNSPDKALEIYQKLQGAQNIEVVLDRRGQTLTKKYDIE